MHSLYFSPCPNDTFVLAALMQKKIPLRREWQVRLHDIETLNELALDSEINNNVGSFFKVSAGALSCLNNSILMPCGMAFTEKAGPIFAARSEAFSKDPQEWKILSPGKRTTACALGSKLLHLAPKLEHVRYDEIVPLLEKGYADGGLLIHESRFTYQEHGLKLVCDLGELWKAQKSLPLVLAALVTNKKTDSRLIEDFIHDFRASLSWAWDNFEKAVLFAALYAQEKDPFIIKAHIDHFVTKLTYCADSSCFESLKELGSNVAPFYLCH